MNATVPHAGRRALLLAGILGAVVATASECDVGCDLPDPSGPDGWRYGAPTTDSAAATAMAAADRSPARQPPAHAGPGTTPTTPTGASG